SNARSVSDRFVGHINYERRDPQTDRKRYEHWMDWMSGNTGFAGHRESSFQKLFFVPGTWFLVICSGPLYFLALVSMPFSARTCAPDAREVQCSLDRFVRRAHKCA